MIEGVNTVHTRMYAPSSVHAWAVLAIWTI